MTSVDLFLDELASDDGWTPSWEDVLHRVSPHELPPSGHSRGSRRRVLMLAFVALLVVLIPLVALAASSDWWFLKHGSTQSRPSRTPVVVGHGAFSGKEWQLVAYPAADGLCWSLTFVGHGNTGQGSALGCGPVIGFPSKRPNPEMTITWLASGGGDGYPAWIAGPVVPTAATVRIRMHDHTVSTKTLAAPSTLGNLHFYAVRIPRVKPQRPTPGQIPRLPLTWIAGYDSHGKIVACLNPSTARDGVSPLSKCR